jgi:acyl-coenzyme A synthetase/AMP-(fatty) acid ligase
LIISRKSILRSSEMMHTSLFGLLLDSAQRWPEKPFLVADYSLSYQQTAIASAKLACMLKEQGVERWDRVAIIGSNCIETVVALFACNYIGAIPSIINENTTAHSLTGIQQSMSASFVFIDRDRSDLLECFNDVASMQLEEVRSYCFETQAGSSAETITRGVALETENQALQNKSLMKMQLMANDRVISTDPALMIYTSGSTGTPKGIVLSQDNVLFASYQIQQRLNYKSDDNIGLFLPLSFDYGLYQVFLAAMAGATLNIFDGSYSGPALASTLEKHRISVLPGVPHLYAMLTKFLVRRSKQLPSIRMCTNTGAHLSQSEIETLQQVLPNVAVFPMYGLTECKRVSILTPEEALKYPGSVGRPLQDTEVFVVDDLGNPLPAGEVGELVVCGRHLALGYWKSEAETALRYRTHPLGVGRALFTGDDFKMDEEGYLYYVGRRDEQIKRHGFRIHRLEIEDCALAIAGVKNACVIQCNDQLILAVTIDAMVFASGTSLELNDKSSHSKAILQILASQLEAYKVPDTVDILSEFPMSANGKTDRKQLLLHYSDETVTELSPQSKSSLQKEHALEGV